MGTEVYPAIEPQRKLGEVTETEVFHTVKEGSGVVVKISCENHSDALRLVGRFPIKYLFVEEDKI